MPLWMNRESDGDKIIPKRSVEDTYFNNTAVAGPPKMDASLNPSAGILRSDDTQNPESCGKRTDTRTTEQKPIDDCMNISYGSGTGYRYLYCTGSLETQLILWRWEKKDWSKSNGKIEPWTEKVMMVMPLSGGHVKRVDATLMLRATEAVRFAERVMVRVVAVCCQDSVRIFPSRRILRQTWNFRFCCVASHQNQFVLPCFLVHPFRLFLIPRHGRSFYDTLSLVLWIWYWFVLLERAPSSSTDISLHREDAKERTNPRCSFLSMNDIFCVCVHVHTPRSLMENGIFDELHLSFQMSHSQKIEFENQSIKHRNLFASSLFLRFV